MKTKDMSPVKMQQLGFTPREFLYVFILSHLSDGESYPKILHEKLRSSFPEKVHSYDFLCRLTKQMEKEGLVAVRVVHRRNILTLTDMGKDLLDTYREQSSERLIEIKKVVDRFVKELTGTGPTMPVTNQLSKEYRSFFTKLVSIKELVLFIILKEAMTYKEIYMGQIRSILMETYGWEVSSGYLYSTAKEMEESGLLVGRWENSKQSRRFLGITEEGIVHFHQITESTGDELLQIQKFINRILLLLKE